MADVVQVVGKRSSLVQYSLMAVELSFKVQWTLELIAMELRLNVGPKGERGDLELVDDVEEGLGDGDVDPTDHAVF
jgi:hypothetical protein